MKKYIIATLIVLALTIFLSKVFYDYHYKDIPPCIRPVTPVTSIMENIIWDPWEYINYRVKHWVEDNVRNTEAYRFELIVENRNLQQRAESNNDVPYLIEEHYMISVSIIDQVVKIEHISTVEMRDIISSDFTDYDGIIYNARDVETQTYTAQITYLKIDDDSVSYYYLEDNNYTVKVFEGSTISEAFMKLLTLEDTRFLGRGLRNMISFEGRFMVLYSQRTVDLSPVYEPFYLMNDESPISGILTEASLHNNANMQEPRVFEFRIILQETSDLADHIYEAVNGAPQQNIYTENDIPYQQTVKLIFYDDLHDLEDITIPNIQ